MPLNQDLTEQRAAVLESKHPLYLPTNLWASEPMEEVEAATTVHDLHVEGEGEVWGGGFAVDDIDIGRPPCSRGWFARSFCCAQQTALTSAVAACRR